MARTNKHKKRYVPRYYFDALLVMFVTLLLLVLILVLSPIVFAKEEFISPINDNVVFVETIVVKEVEKPILVPSKVAKVTAYSCEGLVGQAEILMNCPSLFYGEPKTANGTTPIPNKTMACDRANMGKVFHIEGRGDFTCTDTGGSITGPGRFDLYLPTVQEARQFGVQYINYYEVEK